MARPAGATDWPLTFLLIGAGVVCGFQIGKAPPALPDIRDELRLGLVAGGWLISLYAMFAASAGIFSGALADSAGHRRAVLFGLGCISVGNFTGALAGGAAVLMLGRFVESVGYVSIMVSGPILIAACTASEGDRRLATGIWGSFMPSGTATMMFLAPLALATVGWRGFWLANGLIALVYAFLLARRTRHLATAGRGLAGLMTVLPDVRAVVRSPAPMVLGLFYATYTGNYVAVFGFLPTMLIEDIGFEPKLAALLSGIAVAVNILGNILGGWMRRRQVPLVAILIGGSALTALCALGIFSGALSGWARYALAVLYSTFCGVIPGSTLGAALTLAPRPAVSATTMGWIVQGGAIGNLAWPPMLAAVVTAFGGWHAGPLVVTGSSVAAILLACLVRVLARRQGLV